MAYVDDSELRLRIRKTTPDFPKGVNPIVWLLAYRRVSFWVVKWLAQTRVTPNQVTFFEIGLFIISVVLIGTGRHLWMLVGALLNIVCIYLDYLDGDLARAKGMTSEFGKKLDAANDRLAEVLLPISMTWAVFLQTRSDLVLALGAITITTVYLWSHAKRGLLEAMEEPYETSKRQLNAFQRRIFNAIGVNLGWHTLREVDTRFFFFWLGCVVNQLLPIMVYFLLWSVYELINMYFQYRAHIRG